MFGKKLSCVVAILGLMVFTMLGCANVSAKPSTYPLNSLYMVPSEISFTQNNAGLGTKFNVTVWANMDNGTFTWQGNVTFNPTLLNVTRAGFTAGFHSQFWNAHGPTSVKPVINDLLGMVTFGETLLAPDFGEANNDSLAWIEFQVIAAPNSTVTSLSNVIDFSTKGTYFLTPTLLRFTLTTYNAPYSFVYVPPIVIGTTSQFPLANNVNATEVVTVSVEVTGGVGGIQNATLFYYSSSNATLTSTLMSNATGTWVGTIPGSYPSGTTVYYKIGAYDTAGNYMENSVQTYPVKVPEFTSLLLLMMILAVAGFAVLTTRKKLFR